MKTEPSTASTTIRESLGAYQLDVIARENIRDILRILEGIKRSDAQRIAREDGDNDK